MRIRSQQQLYFKPQSPEVEFSQELVSTTRILEDLPEYGEILEMVLEDLCVSEVARKRGRTGMSAEQVLRSYIIKGRLGISYRALSRLSKDSLSVKEFLKLSPFERGFGFKVLQGNIKRLSGRTIDYMNECLKRYALSI